MVSARGLGYSHYIRIWNGQQKSKDFVSPSTAERSPSLLSAGVKSTEDRYIYAVPLGLTGSIGKAFCLQICKKKPVGDRLCDGGGTELSLLFVLMQFKHSFS